LIRSVTRVTAARANASSVFQLFSFLVVCCGMISKGFGFVAFFASVKAISVCIHISCLVCLQYVVRGVCSHLFYGHKCCSNCNFNVNFNTFFFKDNSRVHRLVLKPLRTNRFSVRQWHLLSKTCYVFRVSHRQAQT